jgi:hypothetical protein
MPRASRKERKAMRERAARAADRGLPTPPVETRRGIGIDAALRTDSPEQPAVASAAAQRRQARGGWYSTWPMSLKLLGLATVLLLGFGLWRTLSARRQAGPDTTRAASAAPSVIAPDAVATQTVNPSR